MNFDQFMRRALELAAQTAGEPAADIPVGAVLVDGQGRIVAEAANQKEKTQDPTDHAEIAAIRQACAQRGDWRLDDLTLVVTLEPCPMCAGAILAARLPMVVFGAFNEQEGAAGTRTDLLRDRVLGSKVQVIPRVLEQECGQLLKDFFQRRR